MKIDIIGQTILLLALILLAILVSGIQWTNTMIIVLMIWQLVSALHLLYVYRHIKRLNFLRTALVLGVSLPVWMNLIGYWAYLPIAGLIFWYFLQTIKDTIVVYNRPRSFWDLM